MMRLMRSCFVYHKSDRSYHVAEFERDVDDVKCKKSSFYASAAMRCWLLSILSLSSLLLSRVCVEEASVHTKTLYSNYCCCVRA